MEETKKISFLKRIKMSIFDLEKYNIFLNERVTKALKYFFKLLLVLVAIFSIATTIQFIQKIEMLFDYVRDEFPNFEYKEGILTVDSFVEAYDRTYDSKLIVDTSDVSEEKLISYNDSAEENSISAVMLKDKAIIRANGVSAELSYVELLDSVNITNLTKETLVKKYNETGFMFQIGTSIFLYSFMVLYVQYLMIVLENVLIVALFGWIASKIISVKLKFSKAFTIAIYGLTLSNLINVVYSIIASFTTFEIKYFNLMYFLIGYIYMMAVIFMNKADLLSEENNGGAGEILQVVENINFTDENNTENDFNKKEKNKKKDKKEDSKKNKKSKDNSNEKNINSKIDEKKSNKKVEEVVEKNTNNKKDNKDIKNEDNKG